jgi:hypothetical protein
MSEAKVGEEFVKHEFDEAIAIHRAIVEAEEILATSHPVPTAKQAIKSALTEDRKFLKQLEKLGAKHGADGKAEEVAGSMQELMRQTVQKASEAESEAYEAHAVLLNAKRKQQDSGAAMIKIARAQKDTELRDAASEFHKATKTSAQQLADELAKFAVQIAGGGQAAASRGSSARASATSSRGSSSGGASRGGSKSSSRGSSSNRG